MGHNVEQYVLWLHEFWQALPLAPLADFVPYGLDIVMSTGKPGVILGWPQPLPFKTRHPAYGDRYLAGMGTGFEGVSGYKTCEG